MKALTVQQPWAWAIFNGKNIENRTQLWKYRGPLAIHAGKRWSDRGANDLRVIEAIIAHESEIDTEMDGLIRSQGLQTCDLSDDTFGAILGVVDLVDIHPDAGCCRPWGESAYVEHGGRQRRRVVHLVHENTRVLAEPIPCSGSRGLWTPPEHVIAQINEEIR